MKSNELELGDMSAGLVEEQFAGSVEQSLMYYAPTSCHGNYPPKRQQKSKAKSSRCKDDPSIEVKIRFYEIKVTATDSAGRQDSDTCRVIMVPRCKKNSMPKSTKTNPGGEEVCQDYHFLKDHDSNEQHTNHHHHHHHHFYKLDYMSRVASQSSVRRTLVIKHLKWVDSLDPPEQVFLDYNENMEYSLEEYFDNLEESNSTDVVVLEDMILNGDSTVLVEKENSINVTALNKPTSSDGTALCVYVSKIFGILLCLTLML